MRSLKFRAWNDKGGTMDYEVCVDMYGHANDGTSFITYDRDKDAVMICSDLKDVNGNPIWEGDIISIKRKDDQVDIAEVYWDLKYSALKWKVRHEHSSTMGFLGDCYTPNTMICDNITVLGNKYENPELLNKQAA